MKKGFTIAETIITMTIIGVIAAVAIPVMNHSKPNKDIIMYNKARNTLQNAVVQVIDRAHEIELAEGTGGYNPERFLENFPARTVCRELAKSVATKGTVDCSKDGSFEEPNFVTIDGIRFWGIGHSSNFTGTDNPLDNDGEAILIDYDLTEADKRTRIRLKYPDNPEKEWVNRDPETNYSDYGLKIVVEGNGKVHTPNWGSYRYETSLIRDALKIKK